MSNYQHIRLELAREPDQPEGDAGLGYDIVAPLDAEGSLDAAAWRAQPDRCRVRRFRDGETEAVGALAHGPGGRWTFDFGDDDRSDEAGFRLDQERFRLGEYVAVRMTDARLHTFRVASMRPVEID